MENMLRSKFEKAYLYFWLCGNRSKLEAQKKKRIIDDENEILKEEFDLRKSSLNI